MSIRYTLMDTVYGVSEEAQQNVRDLVADQPDVELLLQVLGLEEMPDDEDRKTDYNWCFKHDFAKASSVSKPVPQCSRCNKEKYKKGKK